MSALTRKDSEVSDLDYEKAQAPQHVERLDTLQEEDGANVGIAAYHASQNMAEIVSPACPCCRG